MPQILAVFLSGLVASCRIHANVRISDVSSQVFEDLQADISLHLPTIASFLGVDVDAAALETIAGMSSKDFMADPLHVRNITLRRLYITDY